MPSAPELLTAPKIAAALKVTDAKVKNAVSELGLKPAAKKGVCNYYAAGDVPRIKKALKERRRCGGAACQRSRSSGWCSGWRCTATDRSTRS